eukprot:TRINITY_DN34360_c0_g3_i1.p1 TRINITY_DN34360_c0_g3~~TRINITY_DN34360_c0_g3_i1.p1  ORF type:complete len:772 (+),score=134.83 TRINITY_DN34360_c0_g3_i1:66-2381(+)
MPDEVSAERAQGGRVATSSSPAADVVGAEGDSELRVQSFEDEFSRNLEETAERQKWQFGAVGAGIGAVLGLVLVPPVAVAALVAGGAAGMQSAQRKKWRDKFWGGDAKTTSGNAQQRPTSRRLKHLVLWGQRQLLESRDSPFEWRALIVDEVTRGFAPWVQQLFLLRARGLVGEDCAEARNALMHLAPLYILLQENHVTELVVQMVALARRAIDSGAVDAVVMERCRVGFPAIQETISSVDQLRPATHEEAERLLSSGSGVGVAPSLAPRDVRQLRLRRMVDEVSAVLTTPGTSEALRRPATSSVDFLHALGCAALGQQAAAATAKAQKTRGHSDTAVVGGEGASDDGEFFSASEDEAAGTDVGSSRARPGHSTGPSVASGSIEAMGCPLSSGARGGQAARRRPDGSSPVPSPSSLATSAAFAGKAQGTAQAKLEAIWDQLRSTPAGTTKYPDPTVMLQTVQNKDYASLIELQDDVYPEGVAKVICSAGGAVALVRFEWRQEITEQFTGMFRQADHGLIRLSSVTEPQQPAAWSPYPALVPMLGLKMFRDGGAPSANVCLARQKSGQRELNFLAHAASNHFTENVVFPFKAALQLFKKYSDFPTFTGLADFASVGQDGNTEEKPVSPYALVLWAPEHLRTRKVVAKPSLVDQLTDLKAGDVLYEVYVIPEPVAAARVQEALKIRDSTGRIGDSSSSLVWRAGVMRLTAPFAASAFGDQRLFFQHHLFEGDLRLRPEWRSRADRLVGAPEYQELIRCGHLWDPAETPPPVDA